MYHRETSRSDFISNYNIKNKIHICTTNQGHVLSTTLSYQKPEILTAEMQNLADVLIQEDLSEESSEDEELKEAKDNSSENTNKKISVKIIILYLTFQYKQRMCHLILFSFILSFLLLFQIVQHKQMADI